MHIVFCRLWRLFVHVEVAVGHPGRKSSQYGLYRSLSGDARPKRYQPLTELILIPFKVMHLQILTRYLQVTHGLLLAEKKHKLETLAPVEEATWAPRLLLGEIPGLGGHRTEERWDALGKVT